MRKEKKNQSISLKELIGKMKRHSTFSITVTAALSAILCGTIIYMLLPVPKASASELPAGSSATTEETNVQMEDFSKEVRFINEKIDAGQKSIDEIIKQNNTQLETMDHTSEEVRIINERGETLEKLSDKFTNLSEKMDKLDENVGILQDYLAESNVSNSDSHESLNSEITKINEQYELVIKQLSEITAAYEQVRTDLDSAIRNLSEKSSLEHDEIIDALNTVKTDLGTDNGTNFAKLSKEITKYSESSLTYLETLKTDIADSSESLKQLITNTANTNSVSLKEINDNTANWFTLIKEQYGTGNDGLIQLVKDVRTDMTNGFEKVFQSVGDGKKLVASALLTKKVEIEDDATFKEIHDAILSIPQEIVIGVDRLPGQITYEYHHHKDADGKDSSDAQKGVDEQGGCYTIPVYHVHTGDMRSGGGCYTIPVYHYHSGSCYSTFSYRASTDNIVGHCGEENGEQRFEYHCNECGSTFTGTNGWHTHSETVLVCGRSSGSIEGYKTSCGMDSTTIVGYCPGCGLADGQIIGAHIVYENTGVQNSNSEPPVQSRFIMGKSLLSESEQEKLIADRKAALEAEEKEKAQENAADSSDKDASHAASSNAGASNANGAAEGKSDKAGAGTGTSASDKAGAGTGTSASDKAGAGTGTSASDKAGAGTGTSASDKAGAGTGTSASKKAETGNPSVTEKKNVNTAAENEGEKAENSKNEVNVSSANEDKVGKPRTTNAESENSAKDEPAIDSPGKDNLSDTATGAESPVA